MESRSSSYDDFYSLRETKGNIECYICGIYTVAGKDFYSEGKIILAPHNIELLLTCGKSQSKLTISNIGIMYDTDTGDVIMQEKPYKTTKKALKKVGTVK